MTTFMHRLMGVTVFDVDTYEDVEADVSSTAQALAVVAGVAIAAGLGVRGFGAAPGRAFELGVAAIVGWAAWAVLTYEIGARWFPEPQTEVDVGQLLRTLGFSAAPGLLLAAGVWPPFATPVFAFVPLWMLATMIVAVRQALDYTSTARAIAVCVVGWALTIGIMVIVMSRSLS